MATPALRALRAAHPGARIVLEGKAAFAGLLAGLPWQEFLPDPGRGPLAILEEARALRAHCFEWAVLLPDSARTALAPALARIPLRVGYARDLVRRVLLSEPLPPPRAGGRRAAIPMVERYLRITRHLGCPDRGIELELAIDPSTRARVDDALRARGVGACERFVVVTPGASFGSSKLWPAEHFAAACDGIARRLCLRPVLAPAPTEVALAREVAARMELPALVLDAPPLGLEELKALIERSSLVLSTDTGPRQIAVAFGRPVVVVMGPTDPRHTAMHLERQRVLREDVACSPCNRKRCPIDHRCMTRLRPERAVEAAAELLA